MSPLTSRVSDHHGVVVAVATDERHQLRSIGEAEAERFLVERSRRIGIGAVEIDVGEPHGPVTRRRPGGVDGIAVDEAQQAAFGSAHGHDGAAVGRCVRRRGGDDMPALCRDIVRDRREVVP